MRLPLPRLEGLPRSIGRRFREVNASIRSIRSTGRTRELNISCVATKRVCIASYGGNLTPEKLKFLGSIYDAIGIPMCTVNKVGFSGGR